jgi:hypothetical protein
MQPDGCACYYFELLRRTWSGEVADHKIVAHPMRERSDTMRGPVGPSKLRKKLLRQVLSEIFGDGCAAAQYVRKTNARDDREA